MTMRFARVILLIVCALTRIDAWPDVPSRNLYIDRSKNSESEDVVWYDLLDMPLRYPIGLEPDLKQIYIALGGTPLRPHESSVEKKNDWLNKARIVSKRRFTLDVVHHDSVYDFTMTMASGRRQKITGTFNNMRQLQTLQYKQGRRNVNCDKGYSSITVNRGDYEVEVLYKDAGGKVVDREVCRYTGTPSDPPSIAHYDADGNPKNGPEGWHKKFVTVQDGTVRLGYRDAGNHRVAVDLGYSDIVCTPLDEDGVMADTSEFDAFVWKCMMKPQFLAAVFSRGAVFDACAVEVLLMAADYYCKDGEDGGDVFANLPVSPSMADRFPGIIGWDVIKYGVGRKPVAVNGVARCLYGYDDSGELVLVLEYDAEGNRLTHPEYNNDSDINLD